MDIRQKTSDVIRSIKDGFAVPRLRVWLGTLAFALPALLLLVTRSSHSADRFKLYACLVLFVYVVIRHFVRPKNWTERLLITLVLLWTVLGILKTTDYRDLKRMYDRGAVRTWNIYHYYLGSKYFNELGYVDLYTHTILADREMQNRLDHIRKLRDLTDYRKKRVRDLLPDEPNPEFTEERWREFKRDVKAFLPKATPHGWQNMLMDRGYNATPFWNSIGSSLADRYTVRNSGDVLRLASLDLYLYALMFILLWWAFGLESALLSAAALALFPMNERRLIGGFLQYDWLAAIVIGAVFLKKKYPIPSAFAFGIGMLMRMFPLVLAAGLFFPALRQLIQERRIERFYWKFAAAFLLTVMIGVAVGSLNQRGLQSWGDWKDEIGVHNREMVFGGRRVGLKHIFTDPLFKDATKRKHDKRKTFDRQKNYYYAAALVFLALYLGAVWRRPRYDAMVLSMMVVFTLLISSRYYWSMLILLFTWQRRDDNDEWYPALWPAGMVFLICADFFRYAPTQSDFYFHYVRFNYRLAIMLAVWAGLLIAQNLYGMKLLDRPLEFLRPRLGPLGRFLPKSLGVVAPPDPTTQPESVPEPEQEPEPTP